MTKFKLINTMLLFAVLSSNAVADEVSSKAIYDSKTKTLSLDGILVPFIDEFTGKETDNKGIFYVQLEEKTKLVFEFIPWSINFKNTFNGNDTSGYILYDYKTRSVKIPCFEVTTIAKFGDGIQGESIYYKDVNMKQRHVDYPIFHVDNMTKTDSCIPTPQKLTSKAQLKGNLSNANVKIYRVEDNGDKTLLYKEQTNYDGLFYEHKDELEDDKFYIYEVSGGGIEGTIRAVSKGASITKDFKVSLASEIAYIYLAKDLKYDFNATKVENRLNEVAKVILNSDINEDGNIDVSDLLVFDYQTNLNDINSSEFSSDKLEEVVSDIYQGDFGYANGISTATIVSLSYPNARDVTLSEDNTKVFVVNEYYDKNLGKEIFNLTILDITNLTKPREIGKFQMKFTGSMPTEGLTLTTDETKAIVSFGVMGDIGTGFMIIDITDPTNPQEMARFKGGSNAGEVVLSNDDTKVFFANNSTGLKIVDITNPTNPTKIGSFLGDRWITGVTLSQDNTKAYVNDDNHRLVILDITSPTNPTKIGELGKTSGNNGSTGITLSRDGTKAYVTDFSSGLTIIDITNPANPTQVGHYNTNGNAYGVTLSNDGTKAFIADGQNGLVVVDITDPTKPYGVVYYDTGDTKNYAQNVTLSNNDTEAFVADAHKGLVIIDLELFTPISNNSSTK